MRVRCGPVFALTALAVVTVPSRAHAHLVNTGFGPFYDGIAHLFATPQDLLPVLALAIWAGLRGPAHGRAVLLALPLAWLGGVAAAQLVPWPLPGVLTTAVTTAVTGALAAADSPLRRGGLIALALLLGVVHGALNGAVLAQAGLGLRGGAGIACAVFAVVSLGAALVVSLRVPWTRIAVRVAGSWVAATGLLMLGWSTRS